MWEKDWPVMPMGSKYKAENDLYKSEEDTAKKLIYMDGEMYDEKVVKPNGEFVAGKPWFITFVDPAMPEAKAIANSLQHLAYYFQGDIQFAITAIEMEE